MKQLPKNFENLSVFDEDKLELSEMNYLKGGGDDGNGSGGQGGGEDPPVYP